MFFNYDESGFVNKSGKSMAIVRRGRRRVERIASDTKQNFSLMWYGSATGAILPPMIIYKAERVYENWVAGGPDGVEYGKCSWCM